MALSASAMSLSPPGNVVPSIEVDFLTNFSFFLLDSYRCLRSIEETLVGHCVSRVDALKMVDDTCPRGALSSGENGPINISVRISLRTLCYTFLQ